MSTPVYVSLAEHLRASRARRRWRVERAGAPRGLGYGRGWMATCGTSALDATGAWFPTWQQAIDFTNTEIARQLVQEATA